MSSKSVSIPEGLEQKIHDRIEAEKDYQNFSEFVREALRDKLKDENSPNPIEIKRLIKQGEDPEGKSIKELKESLN